MAKSFSLDRVVDVKVQVSPLSAPRSGFNQGLIIGTTNIISPEKRIQEYYSTAEMADAGFEATDPEYIAASIYFSQVPKPDVLWVGRQDTETGSESCLDALIACREANFDWYMGVCLEAEYQDHVDCAAYVESAVPSTVYGFTTDDIDVLDGGDSSPLDIFSYLKSLNYSRTIGQYSTSQGSTFPNNQYAIVAIMGYAMGQNTGLANSAFTLKFKQEIGISTEPLSPTELNFIENNNGNVYVSYGNYYSIFEQGRMSNGSFFDERINLDMLINNIQLTVMDMLVQNPKIPQTDAGVTLLIGACNEACEESYRMGFLGSGVWTGADILNLKKGDPVPNGYLVQAPPMSTQSSADREARKSMPIYIAIKESGAIHSVLIGVYVNR